MNCFQTYLKENNISFEEYKEWFMQLQDGDLVRRNKDNYDSPLETIKSAGPFCKIVKNVKYTLDVEKKDLIFSNSNFKNPMNFPITSDNKLTNCFDEYLKSIGITKEIYEVWFNNQKDSVRLADDANPIEIKKFGCIMICGPLYFKYDSKKETVVYSFDRHKNYEPVTTHFPRISADKLACLRKAYLAGKNESSELINSLQKQLDHYTTMMKLICNKEDSKDG